MAATRNAEEQGRATRPMQGVTVGIFGEQRAPSRRRRRCFPGLCLCPCSSRSCTATGRKLSDLPPLVSLPLVLARPETLARGRIPPPPKKRKKESQKMNLTQKTFDIKTNGSAFSLPLEEPRAPPPQDALALQVSRAGPEAALEVASRAGSQSQALPFEVARGDSTGGGGATAKPVVASAAAAAAAAAAAPPPAAPASSPTAGPSAPPSASPPRPSQILQAVVRSVVPFGAFVELLQESPDAPPPTRHRRPVQALVHASAVSEETSRLSRDDGEEDRRRALEFFAPVGSTVWVKIVGVTERRGRRRWGSGSRGCG